MGHERDFWNTTTRYHDLAKQIDANITITHPDGADCKICGSGCPWAASTVTYYEYRGPRL